MKSKTQMIVAALIAVMGVGLAPTPGLEQSVAQADEAAQEIVTSSGGIYAYARVGKKVVVVPSANSARLRLENPSSRPVCADFETEMNLRLQYVRSVCGAIGGRPPRGSEGACRQAKADLDRSRYAPVFGSSAVYTLAVDGQRPVSPEDARELETQLSSRLRVLPNQVLVFPVTANFGPWQGAELKVSEDAWSRKFEAWGLASRPLRVSGLEITVEGAEVICDLRAGRANLETQAPVEMNLNSDYLFEVDLAWNIRESLRAMTEGSDWSPLEKAAGLGIDISYLLKQSGRGKDLAELKSLTLDLVRILYDGELRMRPFADRTQMELAYFNRTARVVTRYIGRHDEGDPE
ncbi:MAG: hypothetical protein AB7P04_06845 [Bacteriovoracia bacterium]